MAAVANRKIVNDSWKQLKAASQHIIPQRGSKNSLPWRKKMPGSCSSSGGSSGSMIQRDKTSGAVRLWPGYWISPSLPERMECFSISHTGIETVASMVVLKTTSRRRRKYRRFKITKTVQEQADDFKSMASWNGDNERTGPFHHLIVIDGSKGQLHAAAVIRRAGCEAPVVSLAKRIEELTLSKGTHLIR